MKVTLPTFFKSVNRKYPMDPKTTLPPSLSITFQCHPCSLQICHVKQLLRRTLRMSALEVSSPPLWLLALSEWCWKSVKLYWGADISIIFPPTTAWTDWTPCRVDSAPSRPWRSLTWLTTTWTRILFLETSSTLVRNFLFVNLLEAVSSLCPKS